MSNRIYYVLCEDNCKFEGMTKSEILAAIEEAVEEHGTRPIQAEFVESVIDINSNLPLFLWLGTQAEYERLPAKMTNTLYIIAEHHADKQTILTEIQTAFAGLEALDLDELESSLNAVEDDFETAKNKRLQTKADLSTAINSGEAITNAVAVAESKQSEFASQISGFEAVLPDYKTNAENYLNSREELTALWTGSQEISTSGTEISLNQSCDSFNSIIAVGYYSTTIPQRYILRFRCSGKSLDKLTILSIDASDRHLIGIKKVVATFEARENNKAFVKTTSTGGIDGIVLKGIYGIGGVVNGNS